jgi:hypothetical protein
LNQPNEHLPFMSHSNPRTSTLNPSIHISQESLTSSNLISQVCGPHTKEPWYPMLCRVQNNALVLPQLTNSHLPEKTFSLYAMPIKTTFYTMTYSLSHNYSLGLNA